MKAATARVTALGLNTEIEGLLLLVSGYADTQGDQAGKVDWGNVGDLTAIRDGLTNILVGHYAGRHAGSEAKGREEIAANAVELTRGTVAR